MASERIGIPHTQVSRAGANLAPVKGTTVSWTLRIKSVVRQPEPKGDFNGPISICLDRRRKPYRVRANAKRRSHVHQRHRADFAEELPNVPQARFSSPDATDQL